MRDIFKSIGIEYKPGKFEGVWMRGQQIQGATNPEDEVSIRSFMGAVKEMHFIR